MELASDITQQDIHLFLQEADEQLQMLDDNIVRLEREEDNIDLLQQIFRAAHSLKGSSATLGHRQMAALAHHMENVLDGLRKGTLAVSAQLIDALLNSLDVLRVLKEELVSSKDSGVDIDVAIAGLQDVMGEDDSPAQAEVQEPEQTALTLDEDSRSRLEAALAEGQNAYRIRVIINRETSWAAVRCFQVINELSPLGEVISPVPSQKDIEEEKVGFELQLLFTTSKDENAIKGIIGSVAEIDSVEVNCYQESDEIATPSGKKSSSDKAFVVRREDSRMNQTVRIDVSRLDSLMEQVGELVINRNRIDQLSKMLEEKYRGADLVHDLRTSSSQVGLIVNKFQQDIMQIRMLPIETVLAPFPRMIRDLSRNNGKKIDFIIEGQETEVDRSVIEHIRDPLLHLLRNAVDHGVETPETRKAAGKPETGTIRLSACHEQNHIVVTVEDDGNGLDPNNIKKSAVKKELISAEMAARLTDAEAIDLIFTSGLSTAGKTTEVSGRGVGLDVVKTNIESLNGSIAIDSRPGEGTRFKLMLPLTLAIIPALLTSTNHTICAIPLVNIVEATKLEPEDIQTIGGKEVTMLRGNVLPLIRLITFLDKEIEAASHTDQIFIVVVKVGERQAGIIVDSLIEEQEIVIKPLGKHIGSSKGIAGATIMGDGQVALVLDTARLIETVITENQQNIKVAKKETMPSVEKSNDLEQKTEAAKTETLDPSAERSNDLEQRTEAAKTETLDLSMHELLRSGMNNAISGLSQMTMQDVHLTDFSMKKVKVKEIADMYNGPEALMVGVYLGISETSTGRFNGHMVVAYEPQTAFDLIDLLLGQPPSSTKELSEMGQSALGEVGNIIGSFFLNQLSENIGLSLSPSPPVVMMDMVGAILDSVLAEMLEQSDETYVMDTTFGTQDRQVTGKFLVAPLPILAAV